MGVNNTSVVMFLKKLDWQGLPCLIISSRTARMRYKYSNQNYILSKLSRTNTELIFNIFTTNNIPLFVRQEYLLQFALA
jgi:hypothetical protein